MPRFDVRLEATDGSGHFRTYAPEAADEKEARRWVERKEYAMAAFRIDRERIVDICERNGVEIKATGENGQVTQSDIDAALDTLPKPAPRDATDEEKAPHRALSTGDRALLNTHYQEAPYEIVSIKKRKEG